jgi:hypothetical protein
MKYVLIQQPGFKERCLENLETFKAQTSEELIDRYNSSVKTGIVGVYAQAIMLVALRHEIKRRFGVSPILLEDNVILSLTGKVEIRDGDLVYEDGGEGVNWNNMTT